MKLFFRLLLFLLFVLILTPVALVLVGAQSEPLVASGKSMSQADVGRVKALLKQHDPRRLRDGEVRTLKVSERDANVLLHHGLPFPQRQRSDADFANGLATIRYTLRLPDNPVGRYLNLSLQLAEESGSLSVRRIGIGGLSVPGWAVNPLAVAANSVFSGLFEDYRDVMGALQAITVRADAARLTYRWQSELADRIEERGRALLLPAADRERVLVYYGEITKQWKMLAGKASLAELLQPLFQLAQLRTADDAGAVVENRAVFLALGTALSGTSITTIVGDQAGAEPSLTLLLGLKLRGRRDLAKHFGISAALAAGGGTRLADAIGVFKELDDSRGGSGFSFPDLLADRAGTQLATVALGKDALAVQRRLAGPLTEADFMPPIDQLPEGLMEMEFVSRYRNLDTAAYAYVKREIETRIALCAVYRHLPSG